MKIRPIIGNKAIDPISITDLQKLRTEPNDAIATVRAIELVVSIVNDQVDLIIITMVREITNDGTIDGYEKKMTSFFPQTKKKKR